MSVGGLESCYVVLIHRSTRIRVADEEPKRDNSLWLAIGVDVLHSQSDNLRVRYPAQRNRHLIAIKGWSPCSRDTAHDGDIPRVDGRIEGEHSLVGIRITTFYSGETYERHVDVERAGQAMSQARSSAHQVSAAATATLK